MRKYFILFILELILTSCKSNDFKIIKSNENAYLLRNNKSVGEIYKATFSEVYFNNIKDRFTPLLEQVNIAEKIIFVHLKSKKIKNKNDYKRQFIGFIENNEEKILLTLYLDKKIKKRDDSIWKENYIEVLDGGCSYITIILNLKTNKIESFNCNGVA